MSLLEQLRRAGQQVTTGGIAEPIIFTTPGGSVNVTIKGMAIKHHLGVNGETGMRVNSKNARVTISEAVLTAAGYTVRNSNKEVALTNHRVTWADSSGTVWVYTIAETFPDETLGMIVCFLKDCITLPNPPKKIIAWKPAKILAVIADELGPDEQTLDNGDAIPLYYPLNEDGTLTISYVINMSVLTPFMLDEANIQDQPYNKSTGTFNPQTTVGVFLKGNRIAFNAVIPFYLQ